MLESDEVDCLKIFAFGQFVVFPGLVFHLLDFILASFEHFFEVIVGPPSIAFLEGEA